MTTKLKSQTIAVDQKRNDLYFDQRLPTFAPNGSGWCNITRTVTPYESEAIGADLAPRGWIASKRGGKLIVQDCGGYWEIVGPLILCRDFTRI